MIPRSVSVCAIALLLSASLIAQQTGTRQGRQAPDFALDDVSGTTVRLTDLLGRGPILISFWATWCKPCLEELTELQKVYETYKDRGLTMLAISTDSEKSVAKVKPLVRGKGYTFTILLDTNAEVARQFYAQIIPFTVVIDRNGVIVSSHVGYKKGDELGVRRLLEELIR
jgi:cytochrome c biogenesis protein CcmG/thiol:disulfide interchange protein DsbE